jgi:hypothetical protein
LSICQGLPPVPVRQIVANNTFEPTKPMEMPTLQRARGCLSDWKVLSIPLQLSGEQAGSEGVVNLQQVTELPAARAPEVEPLARRSVLSCQG